VELSLSHYTGSIEDDDIVNVFARDKPSKVLDLKLTVDTPIPH
jgi:hypothetical protein